MLIRSFQVQIRYVINDRMYFCQAMVDHARIHPHIHRVDNLVVIFCIVAQQFFRFHFKPAVDTLFSDPLRSRFKQTICIRVQLAALFVHEQRQRHTPGALPRDTPVGARIDHRFNALPPPSGNPLHAPYSRHRLPAQAVLIETYEPLRSREKN